MTEENKKVDESTSKSAEELAAEAKTAEETLYKDKENQPTEEEKAAAEKKAEEDAAAAKEKEEADEAAKKKEEEEKKEEKKEVPEKYEIKIPEKSMISDAQLEKIESRCRDRGFSNEEAQAEVEAVNSTVEEAISISQEESKKELENLAKVEWPKQVKEDKEIGGDNYEENCELSKRVLDKFGTEKFKDFLDDSGFGNHPEVIRVFSRLGKLMSDDKLVFKGSGEGKEEKKIEDTFYDKTE